MALTQLGAVAVETEIRTASCYQDWDKHSNNIHCVTFCSQMVVDKNGICRMIKCDLV